MAQLTNRQRDVLRLLAQGYSQKEAATRLNLAATYVRKVTMEARRRTKTNTTAELVVKSMVK